MGIKSRPGWTVDICISDCTQDRESTCQKCLHKSLYKAPKENDAESMQSMRETQERQ